MLTNKRSTIVLENLNSFDNPNTSFDRCVQQVEYRPTSINNDTLMVDRSAILENILGVMVAVRTEMLGSKPG